MQIHDHNIMAHKAHRPAVVNKTHKPIVEATMGHKTSATVDHKLANPYWSLTYRSRVASMVLGRKDSWPGHGHTSLDCSFIMILNHDSGWRRKRPLRGENKRERR